MRILSLIFVLAMTSTACNTNTTNPGGHTLEETQAKQRENEQKRASQPAPPQQTQGPVNVNGPELYAQNCAVCHKDGANGAPPLAGILNRRELPSGAPATDASLRNTIKMGRANMPAFSGVLTEDQISAIVAYMHTL